MANFLFTVKEGKVSKSFQIICRPFLTKDKNKATDRLQIMVRNFYEDLKTEFKSVEHKMDIIMHDDFFHLCLKVENEVNQANINNLLEKNFKTKILQNPQI